MKLSQKRNCENCRAWDNGRGMPRCELGFNNRGPYIKELGVYRSTPQEPCYKPLTIMQLIEARQLIPRSNQ